MDQQEATAESKDSKWHSYKLDLISFEHTWAQLIYALPVAYRYSELELVS